MKRPPWLSRAAAGVSAPLRRHATAALAIVVAAGGLFVAVQQDGFQVDRFHLEPGEVWVASSGPGQLALLDGASAEVAVQVKVSAPHDDLEATQGQEAGYAVDRTRGAVVRVDGATWRTSAAVQLVPGARGASLSALATDRALYVVDGTDGVVRRADPVTMRPRGGLLSLSAKPAAGSPVVDDSGVLWSLDGDTGDLFRVAGEARVTAPRIADPDSGRLVLAAGRPVVVDPSTGKAVSIDPDSGHPTGSRACVDNSRTDRTVEVAGSSSAREIYTVSGAQGVVRVSDMVTGLCGTAISGIAPEGAKLGVPVEVSHRLFVPDYDTGEVVVVDLDTRTVLATTAPVVNPDRDFELIARDGFVFYNDRSGAKAGVIRLDGTVQPIAKYDVKNPDDGVHNAKPKQADKTHPTGKPAQTPETSPTTSRTNRTSRPTPTGETGEPGQGGPGSGGPGSGGPGSGGPGSGAPGGGGAGGGQPTPTDSGTPTPAASPNPDQGSDLQIQKSDPVVQDQTADLKVQATSGSAVASATWTFGDGSSSADGTAVQHAWHAASTFDVLVQVTRASGAQEVVRTTVKVTAKASDQFTVAVSVSGSGQITSNSAIDCPGTCGASLDAGSKLTLTASPDPGQTFTGWAGDCSGTDKQCVLTVTGSRNITASFAASPPLHAEFHPDGLQAGAGSGEWDATLGQTVTFTNTSTGSLRNVLWTFQDDGSNQPGLDASHTFNTAGTWQVELIVYATNPLPGKDSDSFSVKIVVTPSYSLSVKGQNTGARDPTCFPKGPQCTDWGSGDISISVNGSTAGSCVVNADSFSTCDASADVLDQSTVTITADGTNPMWSGGGCAGSNRTCTFTMSAVTSITITFRPLAQ
jgi:Divergent InlB B-repeat domain/PKD domain